jgi:hypothetical protein
LCGSNSQRNGCAILEFPRLGLKAGVISLTLRLIVPALVLAAPLGRAASLPVTFNKDIAPIIYRNCSSCHHTGESTPFNLITYGEVANRARQIAEVTGLGIMPPWPPQTGGGYPALVGARRLSEADRELIQRWVSGGAIEGTAGDLPPPPQWSSEWQLGPPDLVLEMDRTYNLAAEGKDVYRNFVIPSAVTERRYVRAIEFRPESRAVHHAAIEVDGSRQSRLQEAAEQSPGFPGPMTKSGEMPPGQFLAWTPGKTVTISLPGMPWILDPGTDLVLTSHLRSTGRIEPIRCKLGFYFTNRPPERTAYRLLLASEMIDIPPGATNYSVENSFTLPVDCQALAVHPHCHFLGREVEGHAEMPDGSTLPLLLITNWDFNWQGDYYFQTPVTLPRGSVLRMRITYDNSTNNVRNPNTPPKRVRWGPQSADEMAELCFLLLPERPEDQKFLDAAHQRSVIQTATRGAEANVRENPNDANARVQLGNIRLAQGRIDDAKSEIERAIQLNPDLAKARYYAGLIARLQNRLPDAEREFELSARLDPSDAKTWGNLGFVQIGLSNIKGARESLRRALEIDPTLTLARNMLDQISK